MPSRRRKAAQKPSPEEQKARDRRRLPRIVACKMVAFTIVLLLSVAWLSRGLRSLKRNLKLDGPHTHMGLFEITMFAAYCAPFAGCLGFAIAGIWYLRKIYWRQVGKRERARAEEAKARWQQDQKMELRMAKHRSMEKVLPEIVIHAPEPMQAPAQVKVQEEGWVKRWSSSTARWMMGWDDGFQDGYQRGFEETFPPPAFAASQLSRHRSLKSNGHVR